MDRNQVIETLRAHEGELRAAGVESLSLFGSMARSEPAARDVDLAVRLNRSFSAPALDYFGRLEELEARLTRLLGCAVDIVEEPVRKERFQHAIDKDRSRAF